MTPPYCLAEAFGGKKVQHYPAVLLKPASTGSCSTLLLPDYSEQAWAVMTLSGSFVKARAQTKYSPAALLNSESMLCPLHFPVTLLKPVGMQVNTGDTSRSSALVVEEVCVPGLYVIVTIRRTVLGRLPRSGYHTESKVKHIPSLHAKKA